MTRGRELMDRESTLKLILRLLGSFSLCAIPFIFVPYGLMDEIHRQLGLGGLPEEPIVGYLARSTSAFYALLGGLMWRVSFDPRRHRAVLIYLGGAVAAFGVALCFIDWWEGLPMLWKLWEGPFVVGVGLTILFLSREIED